jgi:polysaccharide export outer membrane protein
MRSLKELCGLVPLVLCGTACILLASCAGVNQEVVSAERSKESRAIIEETYRIGVDDRLQISVWRNPELSVGVPVRPDGMISVPLIGDVQAGGMTPEQVAKIIRDRLVSYVRDPSVTVIVTDLRSGEYLSRVRITGAVRTPRSLPFRQGMTVLDAVLEAGGTNDFAAPNRTKLYRRDKTKTEVLDVELGDILNKGRLGTNVTLVPGDVITVPERLF